MKQLQRPKKNTIHRMFLQRHFLQAFMVPEDEPDWNQIKLVILTHIFVQSRVGKRFSEFSWCNIDYLTLCTKNNIQHSSVPVPTYLRCISANIVKTIPWFFYLCICRHQQVVIFGLKIICKQLLRGIRWYVEHSSSTAGWLGDHVAPSSAQNVNLRPDSSKTLLCFAVWALTDTM